MNIKSLLLGSTAALVAVTGARAADIIVVEPEPVEYVRVCDVYGAGFFYIPGTETCLKIGGNVRLQINVTGDPATNWEGDDYVVGTDVRTRIEFDVREETELGTLRAFARLQGNNVLSGVGGSGTGLPDAARSTQFHQAYVQLGGLLLGHNDSLWKNNIGGISSGLLTDSDLIVGDFRTNQINYTFAAGGFSATLGIEDDGTGDAVPDVIGKLTYTGAWGGAFLSAVYDETVNSNIGGTRNTIGVFGDGLFYDGIPLDADLYIDGGPTFGLPSSFTDGSNDAFAVKAGVELRDLLTAGSRLKIEGHWASDPTPYAVVGGIPYGDIFVDGFVIDSFGGADLVVGPYGFEGGTLPLALEWSIGAGYSQRVGAFNVAVAGQYGELFDRTATVVTGGAFDADGDIVLDLDTVSFGGDYFALVGNVGYNITNNFGVLAEVNYRHVDLDGDLGSFDQTAGFLRFQRNF